MPVAALYVNRDSIYKTLLSPDKCWDNIRDARVYDGDDSLIVHPPCAGYSARLRHLARINEVRDELAFVALRQVRTNGGVLEHPAHSKFWECAQLPVVGGLEIDGYGGFSFEFLQGDMGHIAPKKTWLYIVPRANVVDIRGAVFSIMPPIIRHKNNPDFLWGAKPAGARRFFGLSMPVKSYRTFTPFPVARMLIKIARLTGDSC